MKNELEITIIEQPGELSTAKMNWIAKLVVEYAKAHPELLAEFEKLSAEGGAKNDVVA